MSPIKLSFRTIQRVPVEKGTRLSNTISSNPMVLWRDYLIGSYFRARGGLFLWSMKEKSIFYFEVCHVSFSSPSALNPNSRQMEFAPRCTKVFDDVLFVSLDAFYGTHWNLAYRCIHIPSLVRSTQLPDGSLSLTENAFAVLQPNCVMNPCPRGSLYSAHTTVYSIHDCPPTHPRYCFIIKRFVGQSCKVEWEVLEVEIDLSIPGPIKVFSRVSQQYTVQRPTYPIHDSNEDLLLHLPLGRGRRPRASPSLRFLRVGKPDKWQVARLGGVDKMRLSSLCVDRDAGCVIGEDWPQSTYHRSFIWWLDESKPGNMVYSRTKELISTWSRGLKWSF